MASGQDFLRDYRFKIYIGGFRSAGFAMCSGLGAKNSFRNINEGGALTPIPLLESVSFPPLILKKGLTRTDSDAYYWWESSMFMDTVSNLLNVRNIIVEVESNLQSNASGMFSISTKNPPVRYKVSGAKVESVDFGDLDSHSDKIIAVQTLVLVHSGIERIQFLGGAI